jgi:hypothetical protein
MNRTFAVTAAAAAAMLSLAALPADAQNPRGEGRERARARSAQSGGGERESRGSRAVPRPAESRQSSAVQEAPRDIQGRRNQGSRAASRGSGSPSYSPPAHSAPQYRPGGSQARTYPDSRRGYSPSGGGYERYGSHGYVRPPHYRPYRPYYFSRPYYGFRPYVHIGFGVWLGAAVPYPWAYFGAYVPRVYGSYGREYYGRTYVGAAPAVQQYGGVSFDIQPTDADLFVDGEYVGAVGTFTPWGEPLTLWPGVHRIAIVRDGFRTMEWEVTVQPGQVIPYRGMLARW